MKKVLAVLLVLMMLTSAFVVSIQAIGADEIQQDNADCACGGSYGIWNYPTGGNCVGGRYVRVCDTCGDKQTAKDVTPTTVSFSVPAIG